jgi:hypothetical protein
VASAFGPTSAILLPQKAQRPPSVAKIHSHPEIGWLEQTSLLCALEYSAGRRLGPSAGSCPKLARVAWVSGTFAFGVSLRFYSGMIAAEMHYAPPPQGVLHT